MKTTKAKRYVRKPNNSGTNNNNNNNNNNNVADAAANTDNTRTASNYIMDDPPPAPAGNNVNNRRNAAASNRRAGQARTLGDELMEVNRPLRVPDNIGAYVRRSHPDEDPFYLTRDRVAQGPGRRESDSLAIIQRDLDKLKKEAKRIPQVAKVGSGISSGALAAVHMFCDPARSAAVPLPGRQPSSQVKCTTLGATSIPLYNGEAGIIVTPMGKQQYWLTKGWYENAPYPLNEELLPYINPHDNSQVNGYDYPVIHNKGNSDSVISAAIMTKKLYSAGITAKASVESLAAGSRPKLLHTFTMSRNGNAQASGGIFFEPLPNDGTLAVFSRVTNLADGTVVQNWTSQLIELPGGSSVIISPSTTLNQAIEYQSSQVVALLPAPDQSSYYYQVGLNFTPTQRNVNHLWEMRISAAATANVPPNRADGVAGYLAPYFVNDLTTWDGYTMPAVINLEQGRYTEQGQFIALSGLITNDSSSLNNGGMLMQLSAYTDAFGPQRSVKSYIASTNSRQYIGALRYGGYQIYVPTNLQLLSYDDWASNPFVSKPGQEQYNMLYWIDYSASPLQGQSIPSIVACHLKVDGVFSTTSLSAFVDPTLIPADYSIYTALGLLRHAYAPCENPDHMEKIRSWLTSAIKGTINYGKNMITEFTPELTEIAGKAVKTLVPLAIGAACAL